MATKCLARPRVRAFGFCVEGALVGSSLGRTRHRVPSQLCTAYPPSDAARSIEKPLPCRYFATARYPEQSKASSSLGSLHIEKQLSEILTKAKSLTQSTTVPSEQSSQEALKSCERLAEALAGIEIDSDAESPNPTSNLLDLEDRRKRTDTQVRALTRAKRDRIADEASKAAYAIVTTPQVFITPPLLTIYVDTQALLNRPETIPPILEIYASKPLPRPDSSPIEYTDPNPNKASSAIPISIASTALDAAIDARNLPVCFDIVNTTVCAPAFRRNKLVRRALVPALGAAIAPAAAYSAASQWAAWQDTLDNEMARNVMFAGLLAYISFTATIGIVAVTTSNDQMDRVTWAGGTPLRERWLREDERAFVDRLAGAWGFQETWRRGEEEGPDWQKLREWAGLRGMVIDKTGLMEGME